MNRCMITMGRLAVVGLLTGVAAAAEWVGPAGDAGEEFGVYLFRHEFELAEVPESLEVGVSADNRYRLFLNGEELSNGPARGDLARWREDTIELAPGLKSGRNVLAAVVWNFAEHKPVAQVTARTGFRVASTRDELETGSGGWRMLRSEGHAPLVQEWWKWARGWYACGAGERRDGRELPRGWREAGFDDTGWSVPPVIEEAPWTLVPRPFPLFGWERHEFEVVAEDGVRRTPLEADLEIPAGGERTLVLDAGKLLIGDPRFRFRGGEGAEIEFVYAESPIGEGGMKGNRDVLTDKSIQGLSDLYIANGGEGQEFRPLQWRCARYIEVRVTTREEPLVIEDAAFYFSAYPFERRGSFESNDPALDEIFEVGLWTLRNCAHETYMDCPYYERLDYPGDTYVQARTTLFGFGDDRLIRSAIDLYPGWRDPRGFVMSAYPQQRLEEDGGAVIPNYSLSLADMIHDHYWHIGDAEYTRSKLGLIDEFLAAYAEYVDEEAGLLGPVPGWTFIDWAFKRGGPAGCDRDDPKGESAILTMVYLQSLQHALVLHERLGGTPNTAEWQRLEKVLREGVWRRCWSEDEGLVLDHPELGGRSQHAQVLAVLTDVAPEERQAELLLRGMQEDVRQVYGFYKCYLFQALRKAGIGALFYDQLGEYHQVLSKGLTTLPESLDQRGGSDRSDCHAWTSAPSYEALATVLGVQPAEPGFARVSIEPHLGPLLRASGTVPTPRGEIEVALERQPAGRGNERRRFVAKVTLPEGVSGEFAWQGERRELVAGEQEIVVEVE